jgi:hypothetical protein
MRRFSGHVEVASSNRTILTTHRAGISITPLSISRSSSPTTIADPASTLMRSSSWIRRPIERQVWTFSGSNAS